MKINEDYAMKITTAFVICRGRSLSDDRSVSSLKLTVYDG